LKLMAALVREARRGHESEITYLSDDRDLMPTVGLKKTSTMSEHAARAIVETKSTTPVKAQPRPLPAVRPARSAWSPVPMYAGAAATIVVVVTFGFTSLKSNSAYATNIVRHLPSGAFSASAAAAASTTDSIVEKYLSKTIDYVRNESAVQ